MKMKLHYLLMALFGLVLFACEPNESEIIKPDAIDDNGLSSVIDNGNGEVVCPEPVSYPLRYGFEFENLTVDGDVQIWNDETNLYVKVTSAEGFNGNTDPDLYLFVDADLNNLPLNSFSFPDLDPTLFDHTANVAGTMHTFEIPLASIPGYNQVCGEQELYVFLAAEVITGGFPLIAYAGSTFVDGSAPWYYDTYTPQCCEGGGEESCETAFAKFPVQGDGVEGYVFTDKDKANPEGYPMLGIDTRWGWAGAICEDGDYEFPIWAAAGQNDTNKGAWVGTLYVTVDEGEIEVCFEMDGDYEMSELHIYASSDAPETAAPGQYGYVLEFEEGEDDHCASFEFDGECVWVIAHAEVCGEFDLEEEEEEEE